MRIGIDLDGVVFDSEMLWATYSELYDCLELKRNSIINYEEPRIQEKYNWTIEEKEEYLDRYVNVDNFNIMVGAKEVLKLLKEDGHKLFIVTARGSIANSKTGVEIAKKKIEEAGIQIDKFHWRQTNKVETCLEDNIDIMIDDNYHICEDISQKGIKTIYFRSLGRKHLEETDTLKEVHNWGEIYRYIYDLESNK